ncbi:MAG: response regulator [Methanosarcina sp.]
MKSVLIAEDEHMNYIYMTDLLEGTEVNILYASNGLEAVDIFRKDESIILVLMDIRMPILNGYLATEQMRAIRPGIPIIAQTAYAMESEKKALIECFEDYFVKPIPRNLFRKRLSKYLTFRDE